MTHRDLSLYTFRSANGKEITIKSVDESTARHVAMFNLWGPAHGWCQNMGTGLHLLEIKDCNGNAPEISYLIGQMGDFHA